MSEHSPPFRSLKVTSHAKGQPCTVNFPKVCRGGTETTISAHIRDRHKGMGTKASDHSIVFSCFWCHTYLDEGHAKKPLISNEELYACIIAGLQQTMEILITDGVVKFPHDAPKRKKTKPRKPPGERSPIRAPAQSQWPTGRKIQNRGAKL